MHIGSADFHQFGFQLFCQTNVIILQTKLVGALIVEESLLDSIGSDLVGLATDVECLGITRLNPENEAESLLSVTLLIEQDVALGSQ